MSFPDSFVGRDYWKTQQHVYKQALVSSATASVYSDASSQHSDDTTSSTSSLTDISEYSSYTSSGAPSLRHPRRVPSSYASTRRCTRPPPPLVRQSERKLHFVDNLVGKPSKTQAQP